MKNESKFANALGFSTHFQSILDQINTNITAKPRPLLSTDTRTTMYFSDFSYEIHYLCHPQFSIAQQATEANGYLNPD